MGLIDDLKRLKPTEKVCSKARWRAWFLYHVWGVWGNAGHAQERSARIAMHSLRVIEKMRVVAVLAASRKGCEKGCLYLPHVILTRGLGMGC